MKVVKIDFENKTFFTEDKLVDIYRDFGFVTCQETEYDGTIMVLIYKK